MIEETLAGMCETAEELKEKFFGVVTGTVINPLDPMALGRVQVQLPFIDDLDLSPWARVAVPMAGPAHGMYFIPNLGDEVLVAFEQGNRDVPYIIGSLWSAMAPPPLPSPLAQIRLIRTLAGNQIMITEAPPSISIMTATGQTILMSTAGIQITAGSDVINMTPDGVTITAPVINLVGTGAINLKAPNINIASEAATNVTGGGACNITAGLVKIN
ncbi:MAG: phage baseplate assembly protein V [Phycisphaerales bacterium]